MFLTAFFYSFWNSGKNYIISQNLYRKFSAVFLIIVVFLIALF